MISFENPNPKILVVGDLILDKYLWGTSDRISPEAPVQVINIETDSTLLGGAGNVVNNLKALGAEVDLISIIGMCETSEEVKNLLTKIGVDTQYLITENGRLTSRKSRIIASQQQVVRYDIESKKEIDAESQKKVLDIFKKIVNSYDVVLLSDYGKGIFSFKLTQNLISISNINNKKILIDPKGLDYSKYKGAYLLTPNKKEASQATNIEIIDNKTLNKALLQLKKDCHLDLSLITLSDEGVALFDNDLKIFPTVSREVFDVTGAGDTVLASLGFALSCGKKIDFAIKFANLASGVVVSKIGSATASMDEIIEYESGLKKSSTESQIKSWAEIKNIIDGLKLNKKKIIFTNGCFDILHVGHVKYLEEAKSYGDILVVGINSDNSVKRLKGKKRPINNQNDRASIISSIAAVDYVVMFDEDTPIELITLIKPDLLVKGGDYEGKKIVGQDIAGELKLIRYIEDKSTSVIIDRIKNL